jgi:hypothetical protein
MVIITCGKRKQKTLKITQQGKRCMKTAKMCECVNTDEDDSR